MPVDDDRSTESINRRLVNVQDDGVTRRKIVNKHVLLTRSRRDKIALRYAESRDERTNRHWIAPEIELFKYN